MSLAALPLAAAARLTGGRIERSGGVLEASGGFLRLLLSRAVPGFPIAAITLGEVVLAIDPEAMDACRAHERVHVEQFRRWGGLFPLVYLAASCEALLRRRSPWAGNRFEQEAFLAEPATG